MRIYSSVHSRSLGLRNLKDRLGTLYRDLHWFVHGYRAHKLDRYIFCRQRGGFNDSLAQTGRCLSYALLHRRKVVVSAINAGQLQQFGRYFSVHPSARRSIFLSDSLRAFTRSQNIFPAKLSADPDKLLPVWDLETKLHIDPKTRVPIRFEDKPYPHSILLHEQCGGGPGWSTLERLQLTTEACRAIWERLRHLPHKYTAVHIRNTDYSTDWKRFLDSVSAKTLQQLPCLICTDNPATVQEARQYLPAATFLSIYPFPQGLADGESLHYSPKAQGWEYDIGMLADLVAMARAQSLFIGSHQAGGFSGFGQLALDLHRRPHLVTRLLRGSR